MDALTLQKKPSGKSDAKRAPAVARSFFRAQTINDVSGVALSAVRRGAASRALASNREGKLKVSERSRRIARYVDVGKGDGPVTPDFTRRITFALARGDFAPVPCREGL
eukprot:6196997-Pleurochrysis_carterae.AAC.2